MAGMTSFGAISAFALACAVFSIAGAEENSSSASKGSNAPALALTEALKTNAVGTFKISPSWTGQCAVVFATGTFKAPEAPAFATNRYQLKFDLGVIAPKASVGHVGPRGLATHDTNGGYRALHTYRDSLPNDPKIKTAVHLSDLIDSLGVPQGFSAAAGYGPQPLDQLHWRFVTSREDSLHTLEVRALCDKGPRPKEAQINSIEILRGTARPEIKPPKKT